jgi:transglutaminase-like putative cysteine protease
MTLSRRMTLTVAVACVLASTVLYPLFNGSEWFYAGMGAVIAVAASAALSRLRALPVLVCLAISVLGLLLYLNLVFEARHSLLVVIPTPTSISRLWHLAGTGMTDASKYAPPAPDLPGLVLLAAGGIGITAVLTDLIAVRLRSAALAGLPLLVLFTVPLTMNPPSGEGTVVVFCLGAAGYLAMLSADGRERIRAWGRLVSLWRSGSLDDQSTQGPGRIGAARHGMARDGAGYAGAALAGRAGTAHRVIGPEPGPDTRALAAAGRRVGLASMVLALCVPLIVPGLHPSKLFSSGPGIGGTGGTGAVALPDTLSQTIAELRENHPTTVLTYTTTAPKRLQEGDPQYLRELVFDTLTDSGWQTSDYTAGEAQASSMPSAQGLTELSSAQQVTTTVDVAPGALGARSAPIFLPMPYPPIRISPPPGNWLVDRDLMVFSQESAIAVTSYQVTSLAVDPTPAQLNAAPRPPVMAPDLQLPPSYQVQALKQIAEAITRGQTTEYGMADALATWLSGTQFTYSAAAPAFDTAAGLLTFLRKTKTGVCVQSAYAMTVLARLLGIPARMAGGFTEGTPTSGSTYVVKTDDAHAWTEAYFPGFGWIRFEPTPNGQGTARPGNYQGPALRNGLPGSPAVFPSTGPSGSSNPGPHGVGLPGNRLIPGDGGPGTGPSARSAGTPWAAIALAVVAAIAVACGVIAIAAPPARRILSSHPADAARRRRPVTLTAVVLAVAAAAIVALALSRLLARTSGPDLGAGWAVVGIAFGAACVVMLVAPAAGRMGLRRWRWMLATDDASRAHTAWREFRDDLEDFGVSCRPSEPPRTLADRVTTGLAEPARDAIRRLALAEERACYAARPSRSANLRRDGVTARRGIAASVRRGMRWRARIFPASVMTALADAAARIPDRAAALVSGRWAERTLCRFIPVCDRRGWYATRWCLRFPVGFQAFVACGVLAPTWLVATRQAARRTLHPAVTLLPTAPPFFHALHQPGSSGLPGPGGLAGSGGPGVAGLAAHGSHPSRMPPPANHRPHQREQHDHGPGRLEVHLAGHYPGRQHAPAYQHSDEALRQLTLIVHTWIVGAHETPEFRILPVERLLDLLQLALLVVRERHDASHKPCARHVCGDRHLTYPVHCPEYER